MVAPPTPVAPIGWRALSRGPNQVAVGKIRIFERLDLDPCKLYRKDGVYWVELPHGCSWVGSAVAHRFLKHFLDLLRQSYPDIFKDPPLAPRRHKGTPWPRSDLAPGRPQKRAGGGP
jgi:hypothetical protein